MTAGQARGMMLLIEGAPPGRRNRRHHESVESQLAAWIGLAPVFATDGTPMDSIQVPPGTTQQVARGWILTAAAAPGPLIIHLSGHLVGNADDPHLALRSAETLRVRYDGFPWSWITAALAPRPAGSTLIVGDFTAEPALLAALTTRSQPFGRAPMLASVGPVPDADTSPHQYASTLVAVLRRGLPGRGPTITAEELHTEVTTLADLEPGAISLATDVAVPVMANAGSKGNTPLVSPWTTAAKARDTTPTPPPAAAAPPPAHPHTSPATTIAPPAAPRGHAERVQRIQDAVARGDAADVLPTAAGLVSSLESRLPATHTQVLDARELHAWVLAHVRGRQVEAAHAYMRVAERRTQILGEEHPDVVSAREAAHRLNGTTPTTTTTKAPPETEGQRRPAAPRTPPPTATPTKTPPPEPPRRGTSAQPTPPTTTPPADVQPRVEAILAADQAGDPTTAGRLADTLTADLTARHGPAHPDVLRARELAVLMHVRTGRTADAVEIALDIARIRVATLGADHTETLAAADNALALWLKLPDDTAQAHGEPMLALRTQITGERALARVRSRLDRIRHHAASTSRPATVPTPASPRDVPTHRPPAEAEQPIADIRAAVQAGDFTSAVHTAETLIATLATTYGDDHRDTLAAADLRAQMLAGAGQTAEALAAYVDLAHRLAHQHPPDPVAVQHAALEADAMWHRMGRTAGALRHAHGVLAMHKAVHPAGTPAAQAHRDTIRQQITLASATG